MSSEFFHPNPEPPIQDHSTPVSMPEAAVIRADVFLLNPKNKAFVTGKAREPASHASGPGLLLIICLVVAGIVSAVMALREWVVIVQLGASGESTAGQVIDHRTASGEDSTNYYVSYRYIVGDKPYTQEQMVDVNVYNRLPNGSRVTVRYFQVDPGIARLAEADTNVILGNIPITLFAVGWNIVVVFVARKTIGENRRHKQRSREGRTIPGEVLRSEGHMDEGDYKVTVQYCFQTPKGKSLQGKASRTRNDLKRKPLPEPGAPLAVLYLDDLNYQLL